jgi:ribosome maturation protein Sdo1
VRCCRSASRSRARSARSISRDILTTLLKKLRAIANIPIGNRRLAIKAKFEQEGQQAKNVDSLSKLFAG